MSYGTFIKRTLKGTLRNRAEFFFGTDGSAGPESKDPDVRVASWGRWLPFRGLND